MELCFSSAFRSLVCLWFPLFWIRAGGSKQAEVCVLSNSMLLWFTLRMLLQHLCCNRNYAVKSSLIESVEMSRSCLWLAERAERRLYCQSVRTFCTNDEWYNGNGSNGSYRSARSFVHKTVQTFNKSWLEQTTALLLCYKVTQSYSNAAHAQQTHLRAQLAHTHTQTHTPQLMVLILFSGSNLRALELDH